MTRQAIQQLERRETTGAISLESLRRAADALECDLFIAVIPRSPLERIVEDQARRRAQEERERLQHTMALEAQAEGPDWSEGIEASIQEWKTTRSRKLWESA